MSTKALAGPTTAAGQEMVFEELFRRHYRRVHDLLYRLVGDDADDLAQEVFLRLYQRPPQRRESDVAAWLYRVATNQGYNALRGDRRWRHYAAKLASWLKPREGQSPQEALQSVASTVETNPEAWTQQRETQRAVRATLARMKRQQAALLVLRYSGASYREIAAALEIAPGSVGTLLARAERAFERAYDQCARQGQ